MRNALDCTYRDRDLNFREEERWKERVHIVNWMYMHGWVSYYLS